MAKIHILKKIIEGVKTAFYPLTIPQAVIDPTSGKSARAELDEKANHGYESNPKTLKSVDDAKADHGYDVEETPKTLKEVDDEVIQLAGEVNLLDAVQGAKIKDIENVLSTANLGQSAQLSVSGRKVVSLPKNAANGGMEAKLEGLTAENIVVNGDFRNGTTGWAGHNGGITAVNNELTYTVASFSATARVEKLNDIAIVGHKYYVRGEVYPKYANIVQLSIGGLLAPFSSNIVGQWNKVSVVQTAALSNRFRFYLNTLTNYEIGDTIKFRNIISIDLTSTFGAGNEPTKEQCDLIFSDYFEGVKSFEPTGRVRSVGKNLFDKSKTIDGVRLIETTGDIMISSPSFMSGYIPLTGGQSYILRAKVNSGLNHRVCFYDAEKNFISGLIQELSLPLLFTTPLNAMFLRISSVKTVKDSIMLEKSSVDSIYEPYRETSLYLTAPELRSNGLVKDEIRKGANGYELVKRVGVGTLGSELITNASDREFSSDTGFWTKNNGFTIADGAMNINASSGYFGRDGLLVSGKKYLIELDIINWVSGGIRLFSGIAFAYEDIVNKNGRFRFIFTAGATNLRIYATSSGANLSVDNITIKEVGAEIPVSGNAEALIQYVGADSFHYTLATPVITPISHGGILNSAENGTVYHEPIVADAGVYGTNLPILMIDYPIASIEEIIKHENGVDTYLNVASAVVAGDGLSFTHPDLVDGDLVLFTYAFDKESTNGNITATFYDSNVVKIDTVTGKAYRINDVVTNGVLTRTLTEV